MGSKIAHRIAFNGIGTLRGRRANTQQKLAHVMGAVSRSGFLWGGQKAVLNLGTGFAAGSAKAKIAVTNLVFL